MARTDTAWCPGCGNFPIRDVLEKALQELPVPKKDIVLTSGIGQAAKMPHYLDVNFFNGLHGRVPAACRRDQAGQAGPHCHYILR